MTIDMLCAMCAAGECYHPVPEKPDCGERKATTLFVGTALCTPCAIGRIAIERQLAFRGVTGAADSTDTPPDASGNAEVRQYLTELFGPERPSESEPAVEPGE